MTSTDPPGSDPPFKDVHVLLVEDETLVAMLLEDMVEELGAVVSGSASRVSGALAIVRDRKVRIDLALLDVNLGGEDAFPIAEALVERGVPFAFSTGYGNAGLPAKWRDRPTLQKPFTLEQVENVLRQTRDTPTPGSDTF